MTAIIKSFKNHVLNIPGWKTPKKILVIQSDDWGAQRTESPEALQVLAQAGLPVQKCHYARYDSLEGNDDLQALFEVLRPFRDHRGMPLRFTANCLMANPDYEAIEEAGYERFIFEPIEKTAQRSARTERLIELWKEGFSEGFFVPQLHGREHLHTERWLAALRSEDPIAQLTFGHRMFGVSGHLFEPRRKSLLAALDYETLPHRGMAAEALQDALLHFRELFGFESRTFIAPNYVWDDYVEGVLSDNGVRYLQSSRAQRLSALSADKKMSVRRWQGQRNGNGQFYIVRNVQFEPAADPKKDWVATALGEMAAAFRLRAPAVISTHRVNFIGYLSPENRAENLALLKVLLTQAQKKWPDLEFWTTEELGDAMAAGRSV